MATPAITIYTTGWCPYCARARALLTRKGVTWTEVDVEAEPARRAEMIERSGGRRSVPQIFIGDRHVGGSDDLHDLDRSGGLDPLLGTRAG
jgi:glutaredoxin 3